MSKKILNVPRNGSKGPGSRSLGSKGTKGGAAQQPAQVKAMLTAEISLMGTNHSERFYLDPAPAFHYTRQDTGVIVFPFLSNAISLCGFYRRCFLARSFVSKGFEGGTFTVFSAFRNCHSLIGG